MADVAKNLLKVILGIILVIAPIVVALYYGSWGKATVAFLQGGVVILVILIGLLFLFLGFSELKG